MTLLNEVLDFWNANPCGANAVGSPMMTPQFFAEYEQHRYKTEPYILDLLANDDVAGKRVIEVGCGIGTDGVQLVKKGARYLGIDLTPMGALLTRRNILTRGLSGATLNTSVEALPLADNSVDFVYSHGVIHHTPDIDRAVAELHRVLVPGGRIHLMVYNKNSFNYWISIGILRRLGALLLLLPGGVRFASWLSSEPVENLGIHRERFRSQGLRYIFGKDWLNRNTDGAMSPLARVYSRKTAKTLLRGFTEFRFEVANINKRHLPLIGRFLPRRVEDWLGRHFGWHLHIHAVRSA